MSAKSLLRTLTRVLVSLAAAIVVLIGAAWYASRPATPDAFYSAALPSNAQPGTLIRSEPYERVKRADARLWRILYATTRADGSPATASAIVAVPTAAASSPRPVIAWAHGTTGIAPGCAPSVMAAPFANVPAVDALFREGWAFVATDYAGLGTSGGHAYLVGEDAARAVLDAVRAARALAGVALDSRVVVWGHSQGGNAALWTGIRSAAYAPDLVLLGVGAFAPASDLAALVPKVQHTLFGKIVSAYLIEAYAVAYPEIHKAGYVRPATRLVARDIATRCIGGWGTVASLVEAELLPERGIFARDPTDGPLGARLKENTPLAVIAAPVLIAQGSLDDLVLPEVQDGYVKARCAAGRPIDYRRYAGLDHITLVAEKSPLGPDLVAWTRDRFAGRAGADTCVRQ